MVARITTWEMLVNKQGLLKVAQSRYGVTSRKFYTNCTKDSPYTITALYSLHQLLIKLVK